MNFGTRYACALLLTTAVVSTSANLPAYAQDKTKPSAATPGGNQPSRSRSEWEDHIEERDRQQNGIRVDEPKVYDDSMLQQMLTAAQAKLSSMQVLDQGSIVQRLGAVTGASQQASSLGLSVQGPSLPQIVTTNKGATQAITESNQNTGGTSSSESESRAPAGVTNTNQSQQSAGSTSNLQTVSGAATQDVQQTRNAANPPAVTAPPLVTSIPNTGFSVASSDILNEQMQLTYEIANLSLLLDGPLSDRILMGGDAKTIKPRITLGFPVTLTPDRRYKGAVAVVEVEIEKAGDITASGKPQVSKKDCEDREKAGDVKKFQECLDDPKGQPPTVTALLPREKTYNVASITEKNLSIGGGVITQVIGVSGSWLKSSKTYYLVKDQDTVALTFQPDGEPSAKKKVGFLWQFRPVLGQEYVRSGLKQTFVQLAFPSNWQFPSYGKVTVRTYWRRYDRKNGVVKEIIPGSFNESITDQYIANYRLELPPKNFNNSSLEDLGNGQMLVDLYGRFLTGTYVRIGQQFIRSGSPASLFEYHRIRFIAPISDLATKAVALVSRDGEQIPLVIKHQVIPDGQTKPVDRKRPEINCVRVSTVDEANSRIDIELQDSYDKDLPPLVVVIGGRVYGYSDAPIMRKGNMLSAVVPTALVVAHPEVTVKPLFAPHNFEDTAALIDYDAASRTENLLLLEQGKSSAKFILYGNRLGQLKVLYPAGVTPTFIGRKQDEKTLLLLELTADQLKTHKQLVLQRGEERAFAIPLPAVEFKETPKADPKVAARAVVDDKEALIQGAGFEDLVRVTFEGRDVPFKGSPDGKEVRLYKLDVIGVTKSAKIQPLVLIFKHSVSTISLEVVNTKAEIVVK